MNFLDSQAKNKKKTAGVYIYLLRVRKKNWRSLHYSFYRFFILTDILAEFTIARRVLLHR
jgi:hypothetical protein